MSRLELVFQCESANPDGNRDSCKESFRHAPTQRGICSGLNLPRLDDVLEPEAAFMKNFKAYFK